MVQIKVSCQTYKGNWWEADKNFKLTGWTHVQEYLTRVFQENKLKPGELKRVWIDDRLFWDWEEGFVDSITMMKVGSLIPPPPKIKISKPATGSLRIKIANGVVANQTWTGLKWITIT